MEAHEIVKKRLAEVLDKITTHASLEKAARFSIMLMNKRVAAGMDLNGNPFAAYSADYLRLKMGAVLMKPKTKGYRKRVFGKWSGKVDLQVTGAMMKDMNSNIIRNPAIVLYEIEIGYITGKADEASIRKAGYHNVSGAGKGKVLRRFVGLTEDERRQVFDWFRNRL